MKIEDVSREPVDRRLAERATAALKWLRRPCDCTCGCTVSVRFNDVCTLCRSGDHYHGLATYLIQIEERVL